MYIDENTKLITTKIEHLKKEEKLPHYIDDNPSSQTPRLRLPRILFHSAPDKVLEHSHAGLPIAQ